MTPIAAFLRSMSGRVFVLLLFGVVASASLALGLAEAKWRRDLDRLMLERVADRTVDFVRLLDSVPAPRRADLADLGAVGIGLARSGATIQDRAPALSALLAARLGEPVIANGTPLASCLPPPAFGRPRGPGPEPDMRPPRCWIVAVKLKDGAVMRLAVGAPPVADASRGFGPSYLALLALAVAALALVVARMAAAPINAFGDAARELGRDLNRAPLPESGPTEVREAARAFNTMQKRLQRSLTERTQMLSAITHDLQTPLTRLRLRLEKVTDEDLRLRLLADLAAMQSLIREGLELARSAETTEPFAVIDIDSLLESLVEDAIEVGGHIRMAGGCRADVRARPLALRRCLSNLIENALKYGDQVEVSAGRLRDVIVVTIRDHGPGIPEADLEVVFDPFVRLEPSRSRETGGAGLGLAIARTLAEKCNATLALRNHPAGGLEAAVTLQASPSA